VVAICFVMMDMGHTYDKCNFGITSASHRQMTAFGPGHSAHIYSSADVRNLLISLRYIAHTGCARVNVYVLVTGMMHVVTDDFYIAWLVI
jgi:hypothetical protein